MTDVLTLTMNPSIDLSVSVERIAAFHKMRCSTARRDPGGGGINVARVIKRLGGDVAAIYPTGGASGQLLHNLADQEGIQGLTTPVGGETREDFVAVERTSGFQYRFVLPGPHLTQQEWKACLDLAGEAHRHARFVVGSGSLPPGVPEDFYARFAQAAKAAGSKVVIDSSGPPLAAALRAGIYLVKPSLNEFRILTGEPLETQADWVKACRAIVDRGQTEIIALTLGERGALLVTRDQVLRAPALPIERVSVIGAGNSFLGGMIWSLASGHTLETAFRYGVASGSAALLMQGTELCQRKDVERLVSDVKVQAI